ncbi:phosphonate ABC transporter, permease protein PhnE [Leptolyngbya sp. 7M]|uniref:phosphonate ABC transporter, permease protein PhnE n=1 Tax=Leptolyngbya sp. 7M TaxID=2812896 RepID=UPI001B8BF5CC|nr:phosphonate ABC transporter, permease protein PhnE [Leptolyngbya sp. 7M]QYO66070.1 phosphonate ABC transporter, permease protein PhnE [Leptolyngbya sp. 7M]
MPTLGWRERFTAFRATLLLFAVAVVFSLPALTGSGRDLNYLENLRRFAAKFFPPDLSAAPQIIFALGETIQIAVMATLFAAIIAMPLAVAGAQTVAPRWLNLTVRMILNIVRTLPSLIWALIAVAVVGPNPLAGVIGLTFYSVGYLGKFFSDAFESIDTEVPDGLKMSGANAIQAFQYGLLPQVKPLVASHVLWMLEYNIRSAAIIGYVGAGGIGLLLHTYQEFGQWDKFSAVLLFILILVTLLDLFGEWLRKKLLHSD